MLDGSGSGKSSCYSIPNAYQCLGSYVFTDPKGELYDRTAGYLKQQGYNIKVLNLVRPQYSDGYNPLLHIKSGLDVDVIASTIVKGQKNENSSSEPYWDDMAEMLLKSLIYYLIAVAPEEERNLASCAELVRAANANGGSNLLTELISKLPKGHPARTYYKSIEIAPDKTYSSILSSLQSKLGKFDSQEIAELTSTDTINFEDIGNQKTAVYVISSDTHTAYDFLLTIFFAQMIQQLYDYADQNGGKLKEQTFFILDEFANIGKIPDFDKKISTSRSRKISFSVILQNVDQLEAVYEKSYETIMGNCDTHVFLGSNSFKTVEYFSKQLGEKTIKRDSITRNTDKTGWTTGRGYSDQLMGRALMTPDELRRLDNNLCIIFEKGIKPVKTGKYWYFKKPMAKEMASMEISHNDIGEIERGEWRKYDPYNPYSENQEEKTEDLKLESLDDLFEDLDENDEKDKMKNNVEMPKVEPIVQFKEEPLEPILPQLEDDYDLQKELEAKFDELFGPIDDDE
ncbi:MAG: type IV secretory system conjugative DNA transfer family protein [Clostridia bacterium]|nr:type IV secretory system conjugative DNA transfer family protein [Clostridia bacterium]